VFGVVIAERWSVGGHARFRLDPEATGARRRELSAAKVAATPE